MQPRKAMDIIEAVRDPLGDIRKGNPWPVSVFEVTPGGTEISHGAAGGRPAAQLAEGAGELIGVVTRRKASRREVRTGEVQDPQSHYDHVLGAVGALGYLKDAPNQSADPTAPQLEPLVEGSHVPYAWVNDDTKEVIATVPFRDHNVQ